jgi:hypothetical protein
MVRFQHLCATYPQIKLVTEKLGTPDFTSESRGPEADGLMIYYLKTGKAWLCLMKRGSKEASVMGPEAIGKKELAFLRAAKALEQ